MDSFFTVSVLKDGAAFAQYVSKFNFDSSGLSVTYDSATGTVSIATSTSGIVTFAAVKSALALADSSVGFNGQSLTGIGALAMSGALAHTGTTVGFYGTSPIAQQTRPGQITNNSGGNVGSEVVSTEAGAADPAGFELVNDNFATVVDRLNKLEAVVFNLGCTG